MRDQASPYKQWVNTHRATIRAALQPEPSVDVEKRDLSEDTPGYEPDSRKNYNKGWNDCVDAYKRGLLRTPGETNG